MPVETTQEHYLQCDIILLILAQNAYGCLKGVHTLLAPSQLNAQYPEIKGAQLDSQSMDLFIELICICSTGVINIGGNNSKVCFMVQILHRKLLGKPTS